MAKTTPGLPRHLDFDEGETLVTLLERAFARYAPRTAVSWAGESLTFAKVEHASALVARALQAAGLQRGDRVALLLHNNLLYPGCAGTGDHRGPEEGDDLVSGFDVYPNEIEGVVAMHPDVLECACIGALDERSAEAPHLFVVRRLTRVAGRRA